ncbi:hypothetical protein STBA_52670 [Streptomyces sp. MP131-18]|nr:hypothetical protein STBA_52670 [Streptomyces sp. MP131-18]
MNGMDDLITFVRARIEEDEQTARAASAVWGKEDERQARDGLSPASRAHAGRQDPAHVLRQAEALSALTNVMAPIVLGEHNGRAMQGVGMYALFGIAAIWSDHPDFREEWTP